MKVEDQALLEYFRRKGKCEACGRECRSDKLEPHHILTRGAGGGDTALNLIALCKTIPGYYLGCHQELQEGKENRDKCLAIVAAREGLENGDEVLKALYRLQRQPKKCW